MQDTINSALDSINSTVKSLIGLLPGHLVPPTIYPPVNVYPMPDIESGGLIAVDFDVEPKVQKENEDIYYRFRFQLTKKPAETFVSITKFGAHVFDAPTATENTVVDKEAIEIAVKKVDKELKIIPKTVIEKLNGILEVIRRRATYGNGITIHDVHDKSPFVMLMPFFVIKGNSICAIQQCMPLNTDASYAIISVDDNGNLSFPVKAEIEGIPVESIVSEV